MPDDEIEIRAVLDSSAMLSYARGHLHVGELTVEIADEDAYVALPTVSLIRAWAQVGDDEAARARLVLLQTLAGIRVLPLGSDDAARVSRYVRPLKGDPARAHAVWATLSHKAYLLTSDPASVAAVLPAKQIHYIPPTDS